MAQITKETRTCSTLGMSMYATGECANSLILNSIFAFAMLYYTNAIGLSAFLAGQAMFWAMLWDAFSDPIMGHISDNTRSRYGRRHPYILLGGLAMAGIYYFLWQIPGGITDSEIWVFVYLLVMNLLLRTAYTVFIIPYTALGFEICTDYTGRARLQGIRIGMNMAANLLGPALAWAIFFQDKDGHRATAASGNYIRMATWFTLVSVFFVSLVVFSTRKYLKDSRSMQMTGSTIRDFFVDMRDIVLDRNPRWVFLFTVAVLLGVSLMSSLQMYVYEYFMNFGGTQKSFAHGATMVGMGIGSLASSWIVGRLEKKGAVTAGVALNVLSCILMGALFLGKVVIPGSSWWVLGRSVPTGFFVFVCLQWLFWFGNGVMLPIAVSMIADVSEINELRTGINKDGAYAAVYSFVTKAAMSVGIMLSGLLLSAIGFVSGPEAEQSAEVVSRLFSVFVLIGPAASLLSLFLIARYPVTAQYLEQCRRES